MSGDVIPNVDLTTASAATQGPSSPALPQDTYSDEGPQCPHCNRQYTADEDYYFDEMCFTSMTCDGCGEEFRVTVYTSTTWTCEA